MNLRSHVYHCHHLVKRQSATTCLWMQAGVVEVGVGAGTVEVGAGTLEVGAGTGSLACLLPVKHSIASMAL